MAEENTKPIVHLLSASQVLKDAPEVYEALYRHFQKVKADKKVNDEAQNSDSEEEKVPFNLETIRKKTEESQWEQIVDELTLTGRRGHTSCKFAMPTNRNYDKLIALGFNVASSSTDATHIVVYWGD
jgi:hypothetical protein